MRRSRVGFAFAFKGEPPWWYRRRSTRTLMLPIWRRRAIRRMRTHPAPPPPPTRDQTGPPPELLRVLPVARRVPFEGGQWWITAVVIWDDRVGVESVVWDETWTFEPVSVGQRRGAPRFHWHLVAEDDAATRYVNKGGGSGSHGHRSRVGGEFEPAPPADAATFSIALVRRAWPRFETQPPDEPIEVARATINLS